MKFDLPWTIISKIKKNRLNPQKLGPPNERNTVHYEADITIKTNVL